MSLCGGAPEGQGEPNAQVVLRLQSMQSSRPGCTQDVRPCAGPIWMQPSGQIAAIVSTRKVSTGETLHKKGTALGFVTCPLRVGAAK